MRFMASLTTLQKKLTVLQQQHTNTKGNLVCVPETGSWKEMKIMAIGKWPLKIILKKDYQMVMLFSGKPVDQRFNLTLWDSLISKVLLSLPMISKIENILICMTL